MNIKTAIARLEAETAELAELKRKIKEHNARCDSDCNSRDREYCTIRRGFNTCSDCPKDWRIDL
jgi:hypothetical protein